MSTQEVKIKISCHVCGEEENGTAFYIRRDKYLLDLKVEDPSVRYGVCKKCGLVYQNPRITHEVESAFYTDGRYRSFSGDPPSDFLDLHFRFAERDVKWILKALGCSAGSGKRALEIGAGAGFGVLALQRAGWDAVGIDPDEKLAAFGRARYGLNILGDYFTKESFPGEKFSLLFTYNVFEHLLEPLHILQTARGKITPDGYLYINVPTFRHCYGKPTWRQFGSPHTVMFTHRTLGNLLARAGFRIFKHDYHVDGALRVLAQPSEVSQKLPYKENWRLIPMEILIQGCKYFPARYVPSKVFQLLKAALSVTLGKKQNAALKRLVQLKIWIKRRFGLHIWEEDPSQVMSPDEYLTKDH